MHTAEDACHGKRVSDIGFATLARLAIMGLLGIIICPPNCLHLSGLKVVVETLCEGVNGRHNLASVLVNSSMVTENYPNRAVLLQVC